MKTPKDVLAFLIEKAEGYRMFFDSGRKNDHERNASKIGQIVLNSSPGDRELLQQLESKDAIGMRWPNYDYGREIYDEKTKKLVPNPNYRPNRKRPGVVSLPHEKK